MRLNTKKNRISLVVNRQTLMMEYTEVQPKSTPSAWLNKDWSKRKCFCRKGAEANLDILHEFKVRDDDIWIVTLPKCGTTWMQELVWLILHDYNFEKANAIDLELRSPFVDFALLVNPDGKDALQDLDVLSSPRLLKSHYPLPLLPAQLWKKKPKIIYVFRDPKDVAVSYYYHGRSIGNPNSMAQTLDQAATEFIKINSATEQFWSHVLEFYALRNEPNVYYTSFERMKLDLRQVISDICTFLNKSINGEQMEEMLEHLSFRKMKNNPKCGHQHEFEILRNKSDGPYEAHSFVRRGEVGGYKDELSEDVVNLYDDWIEENLQIHGLTLDELLLKA